MYPTRIQTAVLDKIFYDKYMVKKNIEFLCYTLRHIGYRQIMEFTECF